MPMSAHGLQADIPGMGWMKTFLFHVWALPSLMFLLQSWGSKAVRVNAGALSGWSKCLAGAWRAARMAEPPPGSQRAAKPWHCTAASHHPSPRGTVMLEGPGQLPTLTQPQLLPGWGHQFLPVVPAPASLNLYQ